MINIDDVRFIWINRPFISLKF